MSRAIVFSTLLTRSDRGAPVQSAALGRALRRAASGSGSLGLRAMAFSAALLALLLFAISAQAEDMESESGEESSFARDGLYIAGNLSGTWYTDVKSDVRDALTSLGYSFPMEVEKPLGLGVRAGYRFLPHLAAEAHFQWYASADIELDVQTNKANAIQLETLAFTGNLKAYLLTGRVQPYLLTGIGVLHVSTDDKLNLNVVDEGDAFVARFGGGLDFYINDHFAFIAEGGYLLPTGKLDNLNQVVWSVGLQYRF